jgi:prohibitin 1
MEGITGILLAVMAVSIALPFVIYNLQSRGMVPGGAQAKFMWWLPVVGVLIMVIWLAASSGFVILQPGTAGVIIRLGQVTDRVLDPGLHFKAPVIDEVRTYNTQKVIYETMNDASFEGSNADYRDYPVDTTTLDGQQIQVRFTIRFSVDPTRIKEVVGTLGTESQIVEKVVKTESRVHVRNIIREYAAEQLYTGDIQKAQVEIEQRLLPIFSENGIILDAFGIRQIEFQPEYLAAIEQKQIEKEKVQSEKFKAEQEEFRKDAAITKAQGEAEAQKLQRQTLSEELLFKLWIEKWDGQLPQYFMGEKGNTLLQLPNASR